MQDFVQTIPAKNKLSLLSEKFTTFLSRAATLIKGLGVSSATKVKTTARSKKIGKFILIVLVLIALIAGIRNVATRIAAKNSQPGVVSETAITVPIEREFTFPVYDKDKQLSDSIRYTISSAQLTKQIIIKGQPATAVKGRTFLILNLKLVNDFGQSLFLNTRNYIRVQTTSSPDKLAPEIHNDTVEVQPLSTKLTRIGLPVDEKDREFTLYVGQLDGEKEQIYIKFEG